MENSKLHKITDIRQSPAWSNYLKSLNWKTHKFSNNSQIFYKKIKFIGSICKIQRPSNLDTQEIHNFCAENNALFIKTEPSNNYQVSELQKNGFRPSKFPLLPPSTLLIDLRMPLEQLKSNLSSDVSYSIKKAEKQGVEIEFFQQPSQKQLIKLKTVLKSSAKKNNIFSPSINQLRSLVDSFEDKSYLFLSKSNGEYTGGNFYISYKNMVWYLFGGINNLGRENLSGYKLMWESIKKLKEFGHEFLDMGGVRDKRFPKHTKDWKGFSKFKEKFGGEKIQFPKPYIKVYCKLLKPFIN